MATFHKESPAGKLIANRTVELLQIIIENNLSGASDDIPTLGPVFRVTIEKVNP